MTALSVTDCTKILLIISQVLFVLAAIWFMREIAVYLRSKNDLREYEIDITSDLTITQVNEEVDTFITEMWNGYRILNIDWKETFVINEKEETKILTEFAEQVSSTMSPLMRKKLSKFYNDLPNQEGISQLDKHVADKIHMVVLDFSIQARSIQR